MNALAKLSQPANLDDLQRMSKMLAASGYFDAKGPVDVQIAQIATKILAGSELGFGPFASVNGIHIIQGKPAVGANLMASAVKNSARYDYRVREMSSDVCRLEFFERVDGKLESIGISEFSRDDATKAGTQNMHKFARNMLFARAMSNGVRWYCPDVFSGNAVYVPEELGATVDEEGNVVEAPYTVSKPLDTCTDVIFEPSPTTQVESDSTPFYALAWARLTGKDYDLVNWIQALHRKDEPCSDKQYQFLTGIIDGLTGSQHNYVLSILCQSEISSANKPSRMAAKALLRHLQKEVKDEQDNKVVNPDFRADFAAIVTAIAQAAPQTA